MISYVMLTWNRKHFVEKMLNSFYKNKSEDIPYEFLIIDNGSDDGTQHLLQQYSVNDHHIRLWLNNKNKSLNEYKKLFARSKGDFIIVVDDDVIEFPFQFDKTMLRYMTEFSDFGFLSLDVVQNEYTNGAKPDSSQYIDIIKNDMIISEGPAGGWCAIFRRRDYRKIKLLFDFSGKLNMKNVEDGRLIFMFKKILRLKHGVIKGVECLHACGPYYSKLYGYLERDIAKYKLANFEKFVDIYKDYKS